MSLTITLGRRKTAVARLRLTPGTGVVTVNGRDYKNYFPLETLQYIIDQPFIITGTAAQYDVRALLDGGGIKGQAEALRLAISRALVCACCSKVPSLPIDSILNELSTKTLTEFRDAIRDCLSENGI